ncbi:MAG: ZIP family metal transporter [archaeon]
MMNVLMMIMLSTFAVSAISFIGILSFMLKRKILDSLLLVLVALSAGVLIGGAFLHLIPEALGMIEANLVFLYVLLGFAIFFVLEKVLHWRHCHTDNCSVHSFAYMNLYGDALHNFLDGVIIAGSFVAGVPLGITTTLAVALHEIPQEISDFGVLVYGGFKRKKALLMNFATALTAMLGGIIGFMLSSYTAKAIPLLLSIAAGGFLYISASDLVPELHKEKSLKKAMIAFAFFVFGILIMIFSA